jgi:phosphotransferase system  glucose/maltose/N-acetylglucosamine-specific IIC component
VCFDGATQMNNDVLYLLYPAIFVFSMLFIGLVYTVIEFKKMENDQNKDKDKNKDKSKPDDK